VEFQGSFADGGNECVMLRQRPSHAEPHQATGWDIYAKPLVGVGLYPITTLGK
jgi:hypothetical protein